MLATTGDVAAMEGDVGPHTDVSSRVTCAVDLFGPTDFLKMNETAIAEATLDHDAPNSPESQLIGGPIQEKQQKVASANPITYASRDDPPILIIHGTQDPLVPFNQSQLLHAAMTRVGAQSVLITVDGGGHGEGFGPEVSKLVGQFFDHYLRGKSTKWKNLTIEASR